MSEPLPQNRNEREVTDPVTHLPLIVHDHLSNELDDIPHSPKSPTSDQHSPKHEGLEETDNTQPHQSLKRVVEEELRRPRWRLPSDTEVESKTRIYATIVATGATAIAGPIGLLALSTWSKIFGRGGLGWFELSFGTVGCFALSLITGGCVLFFPISPILRLLNGDNQSTTEDTPEGDVHGQTVLDTKDNAQYPPSNIGLLPPSPESAKWLNSLLHTLWPIVNPALFASISDMLEDSLQASLPKLIHGVHVADITQGSEPMRILGIRWLDRGAHAHDGDVFNIEVALAYRARMFHGKGLKDRAQDAHLLLHFLLAGGVTIPIWVDLTGLLATLRLRIQLIPAPPFFSLVTLTFLGQPKINVACTPLAKNFLNVMDIPGLKGYLQSAIDAAVGAYVAPRSLTLDLGWGQGAPDTEAVGVLIVTVQSAKGFKGGDGGSIFGSKEEKKGDTYVTVGWSKWGKPLSSTRIINGEANPVWEETTALLVGPADINAQESLRLQLWDSDLFTADDLLGTVDFPLLDIIKHSENQLSAHEDGLTKTKGKTKITRGTLSWKCGFFSKTALVGSNVSTTGAKSIEDKTKAPATSVAGTEQPQDLVEKAQEIIVKAESEPKNDWPSGIISIRIEQINGLEVEKVREREVKEGGEDEEADDLPSAYCTVIINHQRVYKTRTKLKSNNPFYNATTEKVIRDWRSTQIIIAVRDARVHAPHPLLGVVVLPLRTVLNHHRTSITSTFPLVGGIGFGRMRLTLTFRPVQLHLPPALLGWDLGTLDIAPQVQGSHDLPHDLKECRLVFRTSCGKGKMDANSDVDGWSAQGEGEKIRVAVKKRYASCLVVEFRKPKHKGGLGLGLVSAERKTPAFAVIWLKDIVEGGELELTLPVRKNEGGALARARANCTSEDVDEGKKMGEKIGEIRVKLKLWPGLSGYHLDAKVDGHLQEVMEVLNCAEEAGEVEKDLEFEGQRGEKDSSSEEEGDHASLKSVETVGSGFKELKKSESELHASGKHRGLGSAVREVEHAADKVGAKIAGIFKHHQHEIGIEKEI